MTAGETVYSALVLEHFERPHNVGVFPKQADVISARAGRREQGAEFRLSARVANDVVIDARFEAYGCPHCIAAGSLVTTQLVGQCRDDLQRWTWKQLAQLLEVPTAKRGRLLILEDAVRALAEDWARRF